MFKVVIPSKIDLVKKYPNPDCQVLSIIYFFNFFISMLFYLGAMQWLVVKLGWLLQVFMYSMRKIKWNIHCIEVTENQQTYLIIKFKTIFCPPIILQMTMGTTAAESMNASANIFLGQSEAPLMIRPYLKVIVKHLPPPSYIGYLLPPKTSWSDPTSRFHNIFFYDQYGS